MSFPSGTGREGHCFLVAALHPGHVKSYWNGDVATRVDCVPQRLNSLRNIYPKGWVILTRSFVLEDECFVPEDGWWRLIARNSAVSLYGTIYWSALHCWWWSAVIASDPTRGSRHDFPSGRPGRTLLFSCQQKNINHCNSDITEHTNN